MKPRYKKTEHRTARINKKANSKLIAVKSQQQLYTVTTTNLIALSMSIKYVSPLKNNMLLIIKVKYH